MSKINQIQSAIRALSPGTYQKLMDVYLYKRFGFCNITPLGSHTGTDKTTKGTLDSFVRTENGKFRLIAYGSVSENPFSKIENDILACLDQNKTGIVTNDIEEIICCHTSTNITPVQTKQLCSHFRNTLLIGLGELANDLYFKYPVIAKDYLSIELDTHQIFDVADYKDHASKNPYATSLNMPLLCREKELEELKLMLQETSVLLIYGKSGSGKTRLALELAQCYGSEQKANIKVIKSNDESIYEDLKMTFTDDQGYLVLVDDADQLVQLGHLLEMSNSSSRKHTIKLVLTVRNYAKEKLLRTVKDVCIPSVYILDPLTDENIGEVLKANLNIKNSECIKRIQKIAKGNVRLAIMAGSCVKKGEWNAIQNPFDILDYYFSGIIELMDRKEIVVATLIAFFDSVLLQEESLPTCIAAEYGIDKNSFTEISYTLHKKEIVSIFDDLAVKFEEQNLRDYLLYYVLFKQKWITPSYMIEKAFPKYRGKIVYAFSTLISLFNTEENISYLDVEAKKAWYKIKGQDENVEFQFVETFHAFIPDETLMMIKQKIETLPEKHTDFSLFDFKKNSNYHKIDSRLIQLLISFKYSNLFEDALQLVFYHLERNTEKPMDFYFALGKELGFDPQSYYHTYSREYTLVTELFKYYLDNGTIEAARCLVFCVSNLLGYDFSTTEANGKHSYSIVHFTLASSKEVFAIRALCMKALAALYDNPAYKHYAMQSLLDYFYYPEYDTDKEILAHDIEAFIHYFSHRLTSANFSDCLILNHFNDICKQNNMTENEEILSYEDNHVFMMYRALIGDHTLRYRDRERVRKDKIREICEKNTESEFQQLWKELTKNSTYLKNDWELSTGTSLLFTFLVECPQHFISILDSYISYDTPYGSQFYNIISVLNGILGYKGALDFISRREFSCKNRWLAEIHNTIPENEIDSNTPKMFIENLELQSKNETIYTVSLHTILKINKKFSGFLVQYIDELLRVSDKYPWVISNFLDDLFRDEEANVVTFVHYFIERLDILERTYLVALSGRRFFDHHSNLLKNIINIDLSFLSTITKSLLNNRSYKEYTNLNFLWDQDNYPQLITIVVDTIKDNDKMVCYFNSIGEQLFTHEQDHPNRWVKQDDWLFEYIIKNYDNLELMKYIFRIICNLTEEQRKMEILQFCKYNLSFSDFKSISITPNFASWTGSEIPFLEKRIDFFEDLKKELKGFAYIEHRAYLDRFIQSVRERKEQVLLEEFIEDR